MGQYGETKAREVDQRLHAPFASIAALASIGPADRYDGQVAYSAANGKRWQFSASSTATDTTSAMVVTPNDSPTAGRWLLSEKVIDLKFAVAFGTADAAVLWTVPAGVTLRIQRPFWEITTPFSGGSSSAIGLSSSNAAYNTKGDLQGGASGDLAAALGAGIQGGTIGAKLATSGFVVLVAGDTLRFDRITSAFTAGAGFAHLQAHVIG